MGAIRWGTRGTLPPTVSGIEDMMYIVPPHFPFRFCNILVSHQPAPHILQQNCAHALHKVGKQGIDLEIFHRKSISSKITHSHPQS